MHHMPTPSTNTNKILHQHSPPRPLALIFDLPTPLHRRGVGVLPAFSMRIRHPEPEHTDDAARQMFPAFRARRARLHVIGEDGTILVRGRWERDRGRRRGSSHVRRVAVHRLFAVAAFQRDLAGRRREAGFAVAAAGDGEFGCAGVEADAMEEEAVGVESCSVLGAPGVDEGGGEVARAGVGDGEDGGLEVVVFEDVVLEEGDGFGREASEDDAFDVAVLGAFVGGGGNVGGQLVIGEVHEGDADAEFEGK